MKKEEGKLFDPKFVHFVWDDSLNGKEGFFANNLEDLQNYLELNSAAFFGKYKKSKFVSFPFELNHNAFIFFYRDPHYEVKRAYYKKGKKVQVKKIDINDWVDCDEPLWCKECLYRIKPEEEQYIVYLYRSIGTKPYLTACLGSMWEGAQKMFGAKTKLFVGTEAECIEWYDSRQKFVNVIKAWEDGKKIQVTPKGTDKWVDLHCEQPTWDLRDEYRIKPEEKSEDEKSKRMTNRELAEWLAKGNGEFKIGIGNVYINNFYHIGQENKELSDDYRIRRWGSDEWIEPTVNEYLKDCAL